MLSPSNMHVFNLWFKNAEIIIDIRVQRGPNQAKYIDNPLTYQEIWLQASHVAVSSVNGVYNVG